MAGMSEPHVGADDQVGGVLVLVVLPLLSVLSLVLLLLSWLPVATPVLSPLLPWTFCVPVVLPVLSVTVLRLGWFLQAQDWPSCQPHGRPGNTSLERMKAVSTAVNQPGPEGYDRIPLQAAAPAKGHRVSLLLPTDHQPEPRLGMRTCFV